MHRGSPITRRVLPLLLAAWCLFAVRLAAESPVQSRRVVRLGVLANDTPGACHRRWGATADYLTSELPGYRFELIPIAFGDIVPTVKDGGVDLLLTNPAQTIELTSLDLALPVATLRGSFYGGDYAGVIFWSARRFDIQGARDVRGRTIAAVSPSSLGGWLMQLLEYQEAGIDLQTECHVAFLQSHEDAVRSVLAGQADIGFCRTGVLEAMSSRGEISPDDIRIGTDFAAQGTRGPQHHSTRLYPEWPLLALNHVPRDVASNIRRVLLDMPPDDDAALQSGTAGWIVAANYGEVRRCLRTLGAPPFGDEQEYRRFSTASIRVLGGVAIAGVFAVLVCAILFLRLRSVRHQLETELEHENTLGRSRSFLAAVVGSFPYPVVVIGLDYRVLLANPKARDAYGWEGVEDGIMPCHRFMRERGHPCHDSDDECLLRKVIDSGQAETVHTTHRYANGDEAPVRVHGVPLFGPDGQLHAVVEWAVDEREEAAVPQASAFPAS